MSRSIRVLYVQENHKAAQAVLALFDGLRAHQFAATLEHALSLSEALKRVSHKPFDLILTDLSLPDSQGTNTFLELHKKAQTTPIIVLGMIEEQAMADAVIHLGAQDYLPLSELTVSMLGRVIRFAIERHHLQESLRALSFTDELTGLYNRRGFITLLEQQRALAERTHKGFFVFAADLDFLKNINDTHGHLMGDKALIAAAVCLKNSFRHIDIIARIGGDEFAVIALNANRDSGEQMKRHIKGVVHQFNAETHHPFELSLSIGGVYYDGINAQSLEQLIQAADLDLYRAKKRSHEKRL